MAKKAEKTNLIRTSVATSYNKGFTLLEVLVALTLIALFSAIAVPTLNSVFRTGADSFAVQMASLFREARDRALLSKSVVRIHFDLDKQEYWAEEGPSTLLIPAEKKETKEKEGEKESSSPFRFLKELTPKKKSFPYGIKIVQIILPRQKDPIQSGEADIYFFPNGSGDSAILGIEDFEKRANSLWLKAMTGSSQIQSGLISKEEDFRE